MPQLELYMWRAVMVMKIGIPPGEKRSVTTGLVISSDGNAKHGTEDPCQYLFKVCQP